MPHRRGRPRNGAELPPANRSIADGPQIDAKGSPAQQVANAAGAAIEQTGEQVKAQAYSQKERAAGGLETVADALRQTGEQLSEDGQEMVGQYVEKAADQVDRVTGYLRQRSFDEMVGDVQAYARHQPAIFFGGAFALGFLAARFLKSSQPNGQPEPVRPREEAEPYPWRPVDGEAYNVTPVSPSTLHSSRAQQ